MTSAPRGPRRLFTLISDLPGQVSELVRAELALLKAEVLGKLKQAGIGVAFLLVAAVVLLLFVGVLLTAAVLALSLVMPGWLAALVVAFVLLLVIALLVLLGIRSIKRAMPPVPERSFDSLQRDWYSILGVLSRSDSSSAASAPRRARFDDETDEPGARP